jgi:hypothetical protein
MGDKGLGQPMVDLVHHPRCWAWAATLPWWVLRTAHSSKGEPASVGPTDLAALLRQLLAGIASNLSTANLHWTLDCDHPHLAERPLADVTAKEDPAQEQYPVLHGAVLRAVSSLAAPYASTK